MASVIRGDDNFDSAGIVDGTAKAWVLFDGTGTPAITDSYNVSSVDDYATGNFDVNLSITMSSNRYPIVASVANDEDGNPGNGLASARSQSTTQAQVECTNTSAANVDREQTSVIIFGDEA